MTPPDIAIGGRMQAGKTTAAELLVARHGYERRSLADPIKQVARGEFDWDGRKDRRGRQLLQELGTAGRNYNSDLWLRRFDRRFASRGPWPIVVDDLRLLREAEHLRELGFRLVRIVRPHTPPAEDPLLDAHETETELEEAPFDLIIVNGGTLEDLRRELDRALGPWLEGSADADGGVD